MGFSRDSTGNGSSSVVAVILVIGITVFVSTVLLVGFGSVGTASEGSGAGVKFSESSDGLRVQLITQGTTSESVIVEVNGTKKWLNSTGDTVHITESGLVTVKSVMASGHVTVIDTRRFSYEPSSTVQTPPRTDSTTLTGTVTFETGIANATVQAITETGDRINETTTNSTGQYSLTVPADTVAEVHVIVTGAVQEPARRLHTFGKKPAQTRVVNFDFTTTQFSSPIDTTVNNTPVTIIYQQKNSKNIIGTTYQLQAINNNLNDQYILGRPINAHHTSKWNQGTGFQPIGHYGEHTMFSGTFTGNNYTLSNLHINAERYDVGLFGATDNARITNLHLSNATIHGSYYTGAVIGYAYESHIQNVTITGTVSTPHKFVGGAIGFTENTTTVLNTHTNTSVSGTSDVGGLIGVNNDATVSNSYSTGTVTGTRNIGGLIGTNYNGLHDKTSSVSNSYSTGTVTGTHIVGGLIGNNTGYVTNSHTHAHVSGKHTVGPLIGQTTQTSYISNSFWTHTPHTTTEPPNTIGTKTK